MNGKAMKNYMNILCFSISTKKQTVWLFHYANEEIEGFYSLEIHRMRKTLNYLLKALAIPPKDKKVIFNLRSTKYLIYDFTSCLEFKFLFKFVKKKLNF